MGYGDYSKITADVYIDSTGADHTSNASQFFSGPRVSLSTDRGSFNGQKSIVLDWINGSAVTYLYGDYYGLATVRAFDYDEVFTTVLIPGGEDYNPYEVNEKTLKAAGNPIIMLLGVFFMMFGFAGTYKRR